MLLFCFSVLVVLLCGDVFGANDAKEANAGAKNVMKYDMSLYSQHDYGVKLRQTGPPADPFYNATADALRLGMAIKNSDQQAIIDVLTKRRIGQRLQIVDAYKALFDKVLVNELKEKLSGNLKNLMVALTTPPPQYYAEELHDALYSYNIDVEAIVQVLCILSNYGIRSTAEFYKKLYGTSLVSDLETETWGDLKTFLVSLCQANRDENPNINEEQAMSDAKMLTQAVKNEATDLGMHFIVILSARNYPQLECMRAYLKLHGGKTMEETIEEEFSGSFKDTLMVMMDFLTVRPLYFARRLYASMKGAGTDEKTLIRIIVSRSEIDLDIIKRIFRTLYQSSLESWISDDTSGDFEKALLSLISTFTVNE